MVSDSHDSQKPLSDIMEKYGDASVFLHLGDGIREFDRLRERYPQKQMLSVCGNCDWGSRGDAERLISVAGKRIFLTHGHGYSVKSGLDRLFYRALELGADIALFGHTHIPYTSIENGIHLMNPGSVSQPRRGGPSFGLLDITPQDITATIMYL